MTTTDATDAFDAAERAMWAGRTEAYARGFGRLCAHPVPALLDAAGVAAGTRVLDIGTGTGAAALAAGERARWCGPWTPTPGWWPRLAGAGSPPRSPYCPRCPSGTASSTPCSATSC
ncbi:hypothetical protein [Streptomyces albidocamelliae]|uniref:hypothetical protein n=1 Tax=Streptomyces albidocamelliae TaxID=2981135 RepID=UPI002952E680|nr:hypothetical protein [Streptomyces sp. HUAS 14-6]